MPSLSAELQSQLQPGFFRPLTRPSWPAYVDAADRLLESADEGGQLAREDTLALIREVLASLPDLRFDLDEGAEFHDLRQRAAQLYNKMLEAGWLHERTVSLGVCQVLVTPALRWTIRLLRELAGSGLGELRDFAATLRSLCRDLTEPPALDPARLEPEAMRQTVQDLLDRAEHAGDQMHAVEALILRAERQQLTSASAVETLGRMLVDFHAGEHMVCYDALQEGGLMPRIHAARRVVEEAVTDSLTKERLAAGLGGGDKAYITAESMLRRLERLLSTIPSKQRLIDGRMADFSRLSAQRYRYQTELRGRRPEQVKEYLDKANTQYTGKRFADLGREPGMALLVPSVALHFGTDALASVRRARPPVSLAVETRSTDSEEDALDAQDAIRRANLYVIAPQRAARFLDYHLQKTGQTISTAELGDLPEDDWLDFLAILAYDRATHPGKRKVARWKIHAPRREGGVEPEKIPVDRIGERQIERVTVERLA